MRLFATLGMLFYVSFACGEEVVAELRSDANQTPLMAHSHSDIGIMGPAFDLIGARDSDGFHRRTVRAAVMVKYDSPYDFIAVGLNRNEFSQNDWSKGINSIELTGRKVNRRTAEGFTGNVAITTNTEKLEWHGGFTWNQRFTEKAGMELIFNRDAIETRAALDNQTLANFYAVSLDYAASDRWTVIAMPTYRDFTDGNAQRGGRGWLIYSLLPEYGLSAQLKGQFYDSTRGSDQYFSPDNYERAELGLRFRHAFGDWRVFADAAYGREFINHDIEQPTTTVVLRGERSFSNQIAVGLQLSYYRAAANGTQLDASDDYHWSMTRLYMTIPTD
jgi:hypothetical protein